MGQNETRPDGKGELMKIAVATVEGVSALQFGQHVSEPKKEREKPDDYEARTWKYRCHVMEDGPQKDHVFIPPMAFKLALDGAAKFRGDKIKGKGQATYTKHFASGVLVLEPLILPVKINDIQGQWLFVPSDGKKGGGTRVNRCFPTIHKWGGDVTFHILDDAIIDRPVFEDTLTNAGQFIGIGVFRPERGGYNGRFKVSKVKWSDA